VEPLGARVQSHDNERLNTCHGASLRDYHEMVMATISLKEEAKRNKKE
jgi:hypothetical protein